MRLRCSYCPNPICPHTVVTIPWGWKPTRAPLLAWGVLVCAPTVGVGKLESACCLFSPAGAGVYSRLVDLVGLLPCHTPQLQRLSQEHPVITCPLPVEEGSQTTVDIAFASRVWTEENAQPKCVICVSSGDVQRTVVRNLTPQ